MRTQSLLAVLVLTLNTQAALAAEHAIDQRQTSCIEADSTTAGMTNCTNSARGLWEKEMNIAYRKLIASLPLGDQQALRTAQHRWIMYRDAEFKAIDAIYMSKAGSMYRPMRAADRLEIVKARALQLQAYQHLKDE